MNICKNLFILNYYSNNKVFIYEYIYGTFHDKIIKAIENILQHKLIFACFIFMQVLQSINFQDRKKKQKGPSDAERKKEKAELWSTSQKMIRESEISLPYHRPKQHTLREFLNRFAKFSEK